MTVDIATLQIRIDTLNVRIAADDLERMREASEKAAKSTLKLEDVTKKYTEILSSLGISNNIGQIVKLTDEYTKLTAQLRMSTSSTQEYGEAYDNVKRIAASGQTDLAATAGLYTQMNDATKKLGISQAEVAGITEALNLGVKISGASAADSATAFKGLSDAFADGALSSQQFNAISQAAPEVMAAMAAGLGVSKEALAGFAGAGLITADVMAIALPNALGELRKEAVQFETIGGSFTVLSNNVMEFTARQAESSGAVRLMTSGLEFLSNNLTLVVGVLETLTTAKFATWAAGVVVATYSKVAANRALLASTLAAANADVTATAATSALAAARVAELQATIRASQADVALALTTNGLIPAQARATVASEAHSAALVAQTAATRAASVAAGVLKGALAFMGGYIGLLVTVVGLGVTAWNMWGSSSKDNAEKAVEPMRKSTKDIIAELDKQMVQLAKRNELAKLGVSEKGLDTPAGERMAEISTEMDAVRNRTGKYQSLDKAARDSNMARLQAEFDALQGKLKQLEQQGASGKPTSGTGTGAPSLPAPPTPFEAMMDDMRGKARDLKREVAGYAEMNEAQQFDYRLKELLADRTKKVTAAQQAGFEVARKVIQTRLDEIEVDKQAKAVAEQAQAEAKALSDTRTQAVADAVKEAEAGEKLVAVYGMSKTAIAQNEMALLKEQRAALAVGKENAAQIEYLNALIDAKQRSMTATEELAAKEASAAAAKKASDEWAASAKDIEKSLTDAFMNGFEGGKNLATMFKDKLKSMFNNLVLQPIMSPIAAGFASFLNPGAAQAQGSLANGGGIQALMSSAKGIYESLSTGLSGIGNSVADGVQRGINMLQGSPYSPFVSANGSFATGVGAAASVAAGVMGGVYGGKMISGEYGRNGVVNAGTAIGAGLGTVVFPLVGTAMGALVGGLLGGAANRLFGMGEKKVSSAGISGSLGVDGFTGESYSNWTQKGGLFRKNKKGTDHSEVDAELAASLGDTYAQMKAVTGTFANTLGVNTDGLAKRTQSLNIVMTKDDAANQKAIADFFTGVGDAMAMELVPSLSQLKLKGESASAALQRLAGSYATVDAVLATLGSTSQQAFGAVGVASLAAREQLVKAAGGVEALGNRTAFFAENYLTEAERLAPVQKHVTEQMAALGYASVTTRAQFKDTVLQLANSGALATKTGAEQYAGLMALADAFAKTHAATEDLTKSEQGIADERKSIQEKLDQMTMTSAQLRARERTSVDASNRALYDQLQARQDIASAYETESSALKSTIDRLKTFGDGIRSFKDSLLLGSLSTLTPMQKMAEAQRQYEETLAKAKTGDAAAQSALTAAATAYLTANQVVKSSSDAYAADAARVQADLAALAAIAGTQMSDAQKQLTALDTQVGQLINLNKTAVGIQEAVDALGAALRAGGNVDITGGMQFASAFGMPLAAVDEVMVDAPAAQAMQRYFSAGDGVNEALVAEIKGLREEVRQLRADQDQQTGAIISSNYDANERAADKVSAGASEAARASVWASQSKASIV
ncbi:tape measure protein [Janthinobacterium sp. FW305-128]|uniref:tape measure protein n=1 Tax=Janthinobacterium sp. FW305-128 TaxID=2775055 RepID=UPI001E2E822F|nr:tape measure protein [Janthinobacterium sp. FW305-128]MCC7681858.1 tape measure protein [Janthinobacterium sp. FW305-128]